MKNSRHPFYTIMDLKGDVLFSELNSWSRLDLIEWLSWNDSNGVYKDEESLAEFQIILSRRRSNRNNG
jgi:hypothetical protein